MCSQESSSVFFEIVVKMYGGDGMQSSAHASLVRVVGFSSQRHRVLGSRVPGSGS